MRSTLNTVALAVLLSASGHAQTDEAKFNLGQADRLHKFASSAFKKGFPRQARLIWMQALKLYAPDHAEAHEALGHIRLGTSWSPDPTFVYPTDDTGSSRDGASLFKAYERLKKDLASQHRRQAKAWAKAERTDKSLHHYRMVLRWAKGDKEAQAALDHRVVGTVTGTDLEQTLYDRSKAVEKAVAEQSEVDYPVKQVEVSEPVLDKAQVEYVSVQSEHYLLHGDPSEAKHLSEALVWAERTLRVAREAFPWSAPAKGRWAFFVSKNTYKQILNANASGVPDLQWRLDHTAVSALGDLVVGGVGGKQVLYDAVVRNVAQQHAGFQTAAMKEGVGHTFVGMMFNSNRLFSIDLKKQQGTVASEEDREFTSPNFDIWKTLALEMAWRQTGGVPAIDLPYCEASTFTNEQRIKAWSFCDYVMRRDPKLLRRLDELGVRAQRTGVKRPIQLAEDYSTKTGVTIDQLDKEWEDFWTEATPALQAIRDNTPPLQAISKNVEKWLEAFNAARAKNNAAPVTWSSNLSTRCMAHANYLADNKSERGPFAEHRQEVQLGGTHLGGMFAQMAVVDTAASVGGAKKMFQKWMGIPGYRDVLVHDYLRTVGIYSEGKVLVMNVVAGLGAPRSKRSGFLCHPWKGAQGVPDEVKVADIGPELEVLLEQHGRGGAKVVGYPLTIHFGLDIPGDRSSYRCNVVDSRGRQVEGAILLDTGSIRTSRAPGMVTFYPFEPLPRGEIAVTWTWEIDGQPHSLKASFQTK